jgi:hypothetical protein
MQNVSRIQWLLFNKLSQVTNQRTKKPHTQLQGKFNIPSAAERPRDFLHYETRIVTAVITQSPSSYPIVRQFDEARKFIIQVPF